MSDNRINRDQFRNEKKVPDGNLNDTIKPGSTKSIDEKAIQIEKDRLEQQIVYLNKSVQCLNKLKKLEAYCRPELLDDFKQELNKIMEEIYKELKELYDSLYINKEDLNIELGSLNEHAE